MRIKWMRRILTVALLAMLPLMLAGSEVQPDPTGLLQDNDIAREWAFIKLELARQQTIGELIRIAADPKVSQQMNGPKHRAIVLLGEYRAQEAVPVLIDNLAYVPEGFYSEHMDSPNSVRYVASTALQRIGMPAVPSLIAVIRNSSDRATRELAAFTMRQILGPQWAQARLQTLIPEQTGDDDRQRLAEAAAYVEHYQPDYSEYKALLEKLMESEAGPNPPEK